MKSRFFLLIIITLGSFPAHAWIEDRLGLGVGVGVLYGSELGVKLDYRIDKHLAISLGQGKHSPTVGLQWYLREPNWRWQPRFGLHHGIVDFLNVNVSQEGAGNDYWRDEYFRDFIMEIGSHRTFGYQKSHAIEFALTYPLGDGGYEQRREELGYSRDWFRTFNKAGTIFNLGYRYNF